MKTCTKCKTDKELSEFNKNKRKKDGYQNICRECGKLRSRQYYTENREHHKQVVLDRNNRIRKENKKRVYEIKSLGCTQCSENDPRCIDFHHTDDNKEYNVSWMVVNGYGWDKIQTEIDKCIRLCSNCHRKV